MLNRNLISKWITVGATAVSLLTFTGCESLPGTREQQGAVIGGVGGAVAGAAVGGERHRVLGAILGGAAGAAGGYVIGANSDRITGRDTRGAEEAAQRAQTNPATVEQARNAPTADLNSDGFVTLDEIVAMKRAGVPDEEIVQKARATGQVFELTSDQQRYLEERGVGRYAVIQLMDVNRDLRERLAGQEQSPRDTIGRPQNY